MSQQPAAAAATPRPASPANIVKRDGVYRLYMFVDGRWLETGITSRKFLEITKVADREFKIVHVNAPLDAPPPPPTPSSATKQDGREGASDGPRAKAS
jgi:hypothetical protein